MIHPHSGWFFLFGHTYPDAFQPPDPVAFELRLATAPCLWLMLITAERTETFHPISAHPNKGAAAATPLRL